MEQDTMYKISVTAALTSVPCHYFYKPNSYFIKFIISTISNELFSLLFENGFSYF